MVKIIVISFGETKSKQNLARTVDKQIFNNLYFSSYILVLFVYAYLIYTEDNLVAFY